MTPPPPEIDPRTIHQLGSLVIRGTSGNLQDIIAQLSHPAPLLEILTIEAERDLVVTTALFEGDLSTLRELCLHCIRTRLPWRNMANLTSFTLGYTPPGEISITQLLDFFESAHRLCQVRLSFVPLAPGKQDRRLVSLPCLKLLIICRDQPAFFLVGHLLIPAGAILSTELESPHPPY